MDQRLGKYVLEERLGIGGMAEVFKARLEGPGGFKKALAVKTILPQMCEDPEFLSLFVKEARLSAILDHTNIVRVHDFNRADDRYYIAMEYVDGRDLLSVIRRCREMHRPLRVSEVLLIGLEICRGLSYAHGELTPGSHVVLHRDISPQNVLLSRAGEVKITDFGIAKLLSDIHYTNTGRVIGKNTYMSPEQARCEELDRRADIFSAGCVLWELLTCRKLFSSAEDISVQNETLQIKPPSTHNKEVPVRLDQVVMRALEQNRECRIPSATDLGRGLDDVLAYCPGVCRSTDLSELYRHLFSDEDQKNIELELAEKKKPSLPAKAVRKFQEPPTLRVKPVAAKTKASRPDKTVREIREPPALRVKPVAPGRQRGWARRWAVPVLVVALASLVGTAAAWSTSNCLELLGQVESDSTPTVREALDLFVASLGRVKSEMNPSEDIRSRADSHPPGLVASVSLERDSGTLRGKKKPTKQKVIDYGWLSINAIPWAEVFWNDNSLGVTPLEDIKLPVGKHTLVLVNEVLGVNKNAEVQILKGQLTKKVVDLLK